ncbi:MAG: hypothetical protein HY517_00890 [Candidatus Aenigmarchaeota archaeon]|nr:hypothetical protein [Candidatus Aenigmarchaeota archaeon]
MGLTTVEEAKNAILSAVEGGPVLHSKLLIRYGLPGDDTDYVLNQAADQLRASRSIGAEEGTADRTYFLMKRVD